VKRVYQMRERDFPRILRETLYLLLYFIHTYVRIYTYGLTCCCFSRSNIIKRLKNVIIVSVH
jgi:hypothetical protein